MRPCQRLCVQLLILTTVLIAKAEQRGLKKRHYYIAAVEINWNYSGTKEFGETYKKVVFREYDEGFRQAKAHPPWLGLMGPTLRAEEGETLVVTFKNMANGEYSLHPHGIAYGKQSEGAYYFDNTSQKEKRDDVVRPNEQHVYHWDVTSEISPQNSDPSCLTYSYISHKNVVEDFNSGLIGALLICKPNSLDASGQQVGINHELIFLFGVFNEKESKYMPSNYGADGHIKHTINGYTQGTLPDVSICAHTPVSLHLLGMSSEPEVFSVHMNGQVLQQDGHKVSSVGLISGSTATASMVAVHPGRWLLSSHTMKHMEAGLHGFVTVKQCEGFDAPKRTVTIAQRRQIREWTYYIAAEEVIWDYAPNMPEYTDEDFKSQYLKNSPVRIGQKYKKAVFTLYKNESFTEKLETKQRRNELGILGPVIRAQIRDVIKIVFKNKASRPYSIYPHGLTIEKSQEGVNYPSGGNQFHGVQPGDTHTYEWHVVEQDEPLDEDARCLTRMYHSAVDTPRDIASGLIGPILICKSQSLNVRNVQLKADKEQHAVFAVFDENKSWYLQDNIKENCDQSKVNVADPEFYKSNMRHTINGYMFEGGPVLGFCNGEVATWHMSSVGSQNFIQTATFYGHPFELNKRTEDILSLYPMTGETISMNMDNIGVWLLASLSTHETSKGLRVKFQDVECFRDYQYEYEDEATDEWTVWKPATLDDIEEEDAAKEKQKEEEKLKETTLEVDDYTNKFAEEWGLRSLKNQSSDMEHLDLSVLDYDTVDVPDTHTLVKRETVDLNETEAMAADHNIYITKPTAGHLEHSHNNFDNTSMENNTLNRQQDVTEYNKSRAFDVLSVADSSEEILTRGDVFSYNVPQSGADADNDNNNSTVHELVKMENNTTLGNVAEVGSWNISLNETWNSNMSRILSSIFGHQSSLTNDRINSELLNKLPDRSNPPEPAEKTINNTDDALQTVTKLNSSLTVSLLNSSASSEIMVEGQNTTSVEDLTNQSFWEILLNSINFLLEAPQDRKTTGKSSEVGTDLSTSSDSSSFENNTRSNASSVVTVETIMKNISLGSSSAVSYAVGSSEELGISSSSEEVAIYLQENTTGAIKTKTIKNPAQNWTYDATHEIVAAEIPDHVVKYIPKSKPTKKPLKKVTLRQRPHKGQGMKTKKRKEYVPQARSGLPVPFSPRGFNPGMTPRGSRPIGPKPVSDEEDTLNNPIVIGIPKTDFTDYQLYIPGYEPDHLDFDDAQNVKEEEYEYVAYKDPYSSNEDMKDFTIEDISKYHLKDVRKNTKMYFIAAEEVEWDYAGYGRRREDKSQLNIRETKFKKVVFREYIDGTFTTPNIRGEIDEHLGILGPLIKAEVGQDIMVVFKNNASRPYSLHPNGVTYTKQTEGLNYEDGSKYWHKFDNEVHPSKTFTYLWTVTSAVGPLEGESDCRTWAYYSGVNPEKDIHSGLIGPLLVCREGTLNKSMTDTREFMLLFMTFDESQSWYFQENLETIQKKTRRRSLSPTMIENLQFHAINGIVNSLKGLRMYTSQLVRWHLMNMGSQNDFQSVHFHGQTFFHKKINSYKQAIYPLLPGTFATLEMIPSKPGLWQLETAIGSIQQKGMQTLFLVLDNGKNSAFLLSTIKIIFIFYTYAFIYFIFLECYHPLGLESGSVTDIQMTAKHSRGYWLPHLARLNNAGKYNAWSTDDSHSWIQVDFQRPVVVSRIATQGAKQMFYSQYVVSYAISYSNDRRKWTFYKGDSYGSQGKVFKGNQEAYETKINTFFPPIVGRFFRLHPIEHYGKATVRMEYYGCELDGCSVPLGMESRLIQDSQITASSTANSWYSGSWKPSLGRLNTQGTINAWQANSNDLRQWLQVELLQIKKITGIVTQGAKSLGKEQYVISYSLQYSNDGLQWTDYTDQEAITSKTFIGNTNNNDHVKNYIDPPIFSRFVRILPKSWKNSITMRIELLGCDFE